MVINNESLKLTLELNHSRSVQIPLLLKGNVRIPKRLSMQLSIVSNLLFVKGESGVIKNPKGIHIIEPQSGFPFPKAIPTDITYRDYLCIVRKRYQPVQCIGNMYRTCMCTYAVLFGMTYWSRIWEMTVCSTKVILLRFYMGSQHEDPGLYACVTWEP